jgi:hypothetical protein
VDGEKVGRDEGKLASKGAAGRTDPMDGTRGNLQLPRCSSGVLRTSVTVHPTISDIFPAEEFACSSTADTKMCLGCSK